MSPVIIAQEDVDTISQIIKLPLVEDKFFMEVHVKLRSVDFSAEELSWSDLPFMKGMEDNIVQIEAAIERECNHQFQRIYF